jgi:DNA-binding NarL/FixJ family response regulator
VALQLGRLARLLGDAEAAEAHLRSALAASLAMGFAPYTGYSELELARTAVDRGDRAAAHRHLATARDLAARLGLAPLLREVEAVAVPPLDSPLTAREEEIAGLVAEGLSNRQIAARLYLSARTVENHVAHILVKLGFESRARIASWYADRYRG